MNSNAEPLASPTNRRFRVQNNARALWIVMVVLLLSGFAALKALIGAADAPRVDTATTDETAEPMPGIEVPSDEVYRLRPQTSSTLPTVERLDSDDLLSDDADGWNHLPTATWELVPLDGSEGEPDEVNELARHPELIR